MLLNYLTLPELLPHIETIHIYYNFEGHKIAQVRCISGSWKQKGGKKGKETRFNTNYDLL